MTEHSPLVSVVIVNYNGKTNLGKVLDECIRSVLQSHHVNLEVLLVDNGSMDDSINYLQSEFGGDSRFRIIRLGRNLGTAGGHNEGIKHSKGTLVLLLNSDTFVPRTTIARMANFLMQDDRVGAVGCRILSPNGTIQSEGFVFGRFFPTLGQWHKSSTRYRSTPYGAARRVDWVGGTAIMFRKIIIDTVGMMDEEYYMYHDDLDWCYRIKEHGFEILCLTDVAIIHYGGLTAKRYSGWTVDLLARNYFLFLSKHFGRSYVLIHSFINFFLIMQALMYWMIGSLGRDTRKLRLAKARVKAYGYARRKAYVPS